MHNLISTVYFPTLFVGMCLLANFLEKYIGKNKAKCWKMGTKEWQLNTFCRKKMEIL